MDLRVNGKFRLSAWVPSLDSEGKDTATAFNLIGTNHTNMTLTNSPTWVADTEAGGSVALQFNGTNQFSTTPDRISGTVFSLSLWVKCLSKVNGYFLNQWQAGHPRRLIIGEDGANLFVFIGTDVFTPVSFSINEWMHIAVTRDSSSVVRVYRNNALLGSITAAGELPNVPIQIGGTHRIPDRNTNSRIDDIRLSSDFYETSDIAYLYDNGNGRGRLAQPGIAKKLHPLSTASHPLGTR